MSYPKDMIPAASAAQSYVLPARPEAVPVEAWETVAARLAAAQAHPSPVVRIVETFDVLKARLADLDAAGVAVVAACAEQIVLNQFHGKAAEALPVRDAAIALLPPPPAPEGV